MKSRRNIWFFVLLLLLPSSLLAEPSFLSDIVKEVLRAEGNKDPVTVQVGVRIHQITDVDQKQENFGIVGTIFLYWKDPQLSKALLEDDQQYRSFSNDAFSKLADEHQIKIPKYSIYNQQGKRHTQLAGWSVFKGGENIHFERFSVTLQAPDFNFRQYPFDSQNFFHLNCCYRLHTTLMAI